MDDSPSIGQIPSYYQWNLALSQLFNGNLKRVCFTLHINEDRSIHAVDCQLPPLIYIRQFLNNQAVSHSPDLQRPCTQHSGALILCHVGRRRPFFGCNLPLFHSFHGV